MKKMKRREMLVGVGAGLAGLGAGTFLSLGLVDRETRANEIDGFDSWKYAIIDPVKAADLAYEIYPDGACMYAIVRGLLTTVADTLRSTDPLAASMMMGFPFHMMRYGHAGIGAIGSTCGAFNGGAAVIGLFIKDADKRDAIIRELTVYYENTELPKYKPKDDKFPTMESVVTESVLCHISSSRWRVAANANMFSPKRSDRCRRLTSDIVIKTAELLNRYHTDRNCTFAPLMQPTATCFDCHGSQGMQADSIGKMSCATCHEHDDSHSNKYINMRK